MVVTPAWRRADLATVLLLLFAKAAAERGIHTFTASYLADTGPSPPWSTTPAGWAPRSSETRSPNSPSLSASHKPGPGKHSGGRLR